MNDSQRKAMFARRGGSFSIYGKSRSAHRNRAIAGGVALGAGAAGLLGVRRLAPALFHVTGGYVPTHPNLVKEARDTYRGFMGAREMTSREKALSRVPFLGKLARRALGGEEGSDTVSTIPLLARARTAGAERTRNMLANVAENRTKLLSLLGKKDGVSRIVLGLEHLERKTKEQVARPITAVRKAFLDNPIPQGELPGAELAYIRGNARHLKLTKKIAAAELRRTLDFDQARDMLLERQVAKRGKLSASFEHLDPYSVLANENVKTLIKKEARLSLAPKYPSRAERLAHALVEPASKVVRGANKRLNRRAVDLGLRLGLSVEQG